MKKRGMLLIMGLFLVSLMVGGVSGADETVTTYCTVGAPFACNDVIATPDRAVNISLDVPINASNLNITMTAQGEVCSKIFLTNLREDPSKKIVSCTSAVRFYKGDTVEGEFTIGSANGSYRVTAEGPVMTTANKCPDINVDGVVDQADLDALSKRFGQSASTFPGYDINEDGVLNIKDHVIVARYNGQFVTDIVMCKGRDSINWLRTISPGETIRFNQADLEGVLTIAVTCSSDGGTGGTIQEELGACEDSDGGEDYLVKGETTSVKLSYSSGVQSWTDICLRDSDLYKEGIITPAGGITINGGIMEGVCSSSQTTGVVRIRECLKGCQDGACIGGGILGNVGSAAEDSSGEASTAAPAANPQKQNVIQRIGRALGFFILGE